MCPAGIGSRMFPGISAHSKERLVVKKETNQTEVKFNRTTEPDRIKDIALAVVKYESARREFTLNPYEENNDFQRKARELRIGIDAWKEFLILVVMPVILGAHFGQHIRLIDTGIPRMLDEDQLGTIALRYLQSKGMNTAPREFQNRLQRIERETNIPANELRKFYLEYILTSSVEAIKKG